MYEIETGFIAALNKFFAIVRFDGEYCFEEQGDTREEAKSKAEIRLLEYKAVQGH